MDAIDPDKLFRKTAWHILPVLMLGFFLAYLDRVNVGFAKLEMAPALGFSDGVYGFGAGVFFLGYFLFEVPSNAILHRVGARRWISRIMLTWGLISALTIFIQTPTQFYVMRFLLGLAEAGFAPGVIYYTSQWFPAAYRGRAWSIYYTSLGLAGAAGGVMSGLILSKMSGIGHLASWQWLILLEAVPTLLLGVYIFFFLNERIATAKWLSAHEKQYLTDVLAQENRQKLSIGFGKLMRNRKLWLLIFIYFSYNSALYAISFWTPTLVQSMGVRDQWSIGLFSALPALCATVSMVVFGYSSDRCRERRWHLVTAFSMAATGLLIVVWARHPALGIAGLCLASMGAMSVPTLFWNIPTAMLAGATAAAGIATINATGNLAGFLSPYMIGYVKETTGRADIGMFVIVGLLCLGIVGLLRTPKQAASVSGVPISGTGLNVEGTAN